MASGLATRKGITMAAAGSLVMDYALYPRNEISASHVQEVANAMEAGAEFPPVIADASTHQVIDGFHRIKATIRLYGPEHQIAVEFHKYDSDSERFEAAIQANAAHGKRITTYDIAVISVRAESVGLSRDAVAAALNLTHERHEGLVRDRVAAEVGTTSPVLLKRSVRHMAGTELSPAQAAANEGLTGWSARFHARQLILLIEHDMLGVVDEPTAAEFQRLHHLLAAWA